MKRFLIFGALFPPLALVVFTAPDGFKNLLDWMVMAYAIAVFLPCCWLGSIGRFPQTVFGLWERRPRQH